MSLPENGSATATQPQNTFLPTPKQIRFVSTDGQPHTKRRRINAACLTCRKRKTRCSGEKPECRTCTDNNHVCAGYADKPMVKGDDEDEDEHDSPPKRHKSFPAQPVPPSGSSQTSALAPTPLTSSAPGQLPSTASKGIGNGYSFASTELKSPDNDLTPTSGSVPTRSHRVPFFRYFGRTAIAPGFKQMVVSLKDRDHRRSTLSASGESPASIIQDIAFYDAADTAPVPQLVTHLCDTFFTHLGCNFPFLQRERFMSDLEDKRVDAILVDAVCAIAARFSNDPSLSRTNDTSTPVDEKGHVRRAFRGQPYAQRAASNLVDTFGCPSIAVAQACLLLAYEEFGTDRDSGLWMFLGTSIRMAQDLGISKLEGMQLEGRLGPTPKIVKMRPEDAKAELEKREEQQKRAIQGLIDRGEDENFEDRRASEHERIDTFWSILFLDRAVSSGVGRPVTLRDKAIEISFPRQSDETVINGYPHPFPVMIRIVHLNGRIADVINNIEDSCEVNADGLKKLTAFEKDLTGIYQRMSPKLHFNATNFQHYVKAGHGTTFILLHFWFHTSIILLHQPTLLHSLGTQMQQLFPDSRELSMSSAKTIADILAFAELIDIKSLLCNAFTSQPMYVAACAFLAEARAHASNPASRQASPPDRQEIKSESDRSRYLDAGSKQATKHSLLATAANQNYQRCYKALKVLDTYWAGCRYILTALDQKSKGLMNPILFTQEDIDGEMPSIEPSFTQPGWRKSSLGPSPRRMSVPWTPKMDWSQAIGWSLTGTTNSPAPNFSFLYPSQVEDKPDGDAVTKTRSERGRPEVPLFDHTTAQVNSDHVMSSSHNRAGSLPYDPVSTADADLLLGLHSPYNQNHIQTQPQAQVLANRAGSSAMEYAHCQPPLQRQISHQNHFYASPTAVENTPAFSDMVIQSQDVDVSHQFPTDLNGSANLAFPGGDMIWLEYLPSDVLSFFGQGDDPGDMIMPSGPGPPPQTDQNT